MARLGADVLGIDPLPENVLSAEFHCSRHPDLHSLSYKCTTAEDLCLDHSDKFDIVLASEVLEHVDRPDVFLHSCCKMVKVNLSDFVYFADNMLLWKPTL